MRTLLCMTSWMHQNVLCAMGYTTYASHWYKNITCDVSVFEATFPIKGLGFCLL